MKRILFVLVCLIVLTGLMPVATASVQAAPELNIGDMVMMINSGPTGLAVRSTPGGSIITRKTDGKLGSIIDGPIDAYIADPPGTKLYRWWQVRWGDDGEEGWSADSDPGIEDYLQKQTKPVSTKFSVGQKVQVVNMDTYNYHIRNAPPGLSLQSTSKHENDKGTIVMDSTLSSATYYGVPDLSAGLPLYKGTNNDYFYHFWKIQWDDGQIGWSAEGAMDGDYLAPVSTVTLTLYVHEGSASGPIISGAQVTGEDAADNPFTKTTNASGYVVITGIPGTWNFTASKSGYQTNSWPQSITTTCTKHAFLLEEPVAPPSIAPTLLSPSNGAEVSTNPTFQWQPVDGATYYGLYISEPPYGPGHLVFDSELDYGPISGTSLILPITLQSGVTYHWNMRAGNEAGWGPYSSPWSFTTQTVPTVVTFPDPGLRAAIRAHINKPTGDIYRSDLLNVSVLEASFRDIASLTGLNYCTNLWYLDLQYNRIADISPLAGLTNLYELHLSYNGMIADISPLAGLTNLYWLDLEYNQITDISPLTGLTNLSYLFLSANQIADISPLTGLTNLSALWLDSNQITDISPLTGLTNLSDLGLGYNQIADISPLAGLTNLSSLFLRANQITDISPLTGLTNLSWLWLGGNQIADISPLAGLTNLSDISLENNQITDISPLVSNTGLSAGDFIHLSGNPLSSVSINMYIPQLKARGVNVYYDIPVDTTPPTVSSVSPQDGATDVEVDTNITATFSEAIDASTITNESFTLAGSPVSGTVTYEPNTYTATFIPDADLASNHTYTATLSTAITDLAGNPLTESYSWSFTTEDISTDYHLEVTVDYWQEECVPFLVDIKLVDDFGNIGTDYSGDVDLHDLTMGSGGGYINNGIGIGTFTVYWPCNSDIIFAHFLSPEVPGLEFWGNSNEFYVQPILTDFPPSASYLDLTGQPDIMHPNTPYTVTASYHDDNGASDLSYCYLRLNHPEKPLTMMWNQQTEEFSTYAGEEGENYLTVTGDVIGISDLEYTLSWTFEINQNWPQTEDSIDFGVFAVDDVNLTPWEGWDYDDTNASFRLEDTEPPTVNDFYADKTSVILGESIKFSYEVSDTGGSGLKQVELWEAADTDGDGQPNWPSNPTDYVDIHYLSGDSASGDFDYEPQEPDTHWYGIHVLDNNGNINYETNSETGGLPGVFGPIEINIGKILTVPYYSQGDTDWCVPASMSMILKYYGKNIHSWDIADCWDINRYQPIGALEEQGKVYSFFEEWGLLPENISINFEAIKDSINNNKPVFLSMRGSTYFDDIFPFVHLLGHAIVICGYSEDENGQKVYINDPSGKLIHIGITDDLICSEADWQVVVDYAPVITLPWSYAISVGGEKPNSLMGTINIDDSSLLMSVPGSSGKWLWMYGDNLGLVWADSTGAIVSEPLLVFPDSKFKFSVGIANSEKIDQNFQLDLEFLGSNTPPISTIIPSVKSKELYNVVLPLLLLQDILGNNYGTYLISVTLWNEKHTSFDQILLPTINYRPTLSFRLESPANLFLTDPEGLHIGTNPSSGEVINEIQGATYNGADSEPEIITLLDRKIGDYIIQVIPEPSALPTDIFKLTTLDGIENIILADNVEMNKIPDTGYKIYSSEDGVKILPIACAGGPYTCDEGSQIVFDASGSSDPDGTIVLYDWDFDSDGVYDFNSTDPTVSHVWTDDYSGVVTLRVTDDEGLTDTDTAEVTVGNIPPAVLVDLAYQDVQYSDDICDVTITATDVAGDPMAAASSWSVDGGGFTPGLPDFLSLNDNGSDGGTPTQTHTWTLSGTADIPEGGYTVRISVTDDDGGQTDTDITITVYVEDATVAFDGDNPVAVQVDSPGGDSSPFSLTLYVTETVPDIAVCGAEAGDISLVAVSVDLVPMGVGSSVSGTCTPAGVTGIGYDSVLEVTCDFENVPVNIYTVEVTVEGDYYTGYNEDVLVVYDPSLGFTTGGGYFYWPGTNEKTNFGFTMKYNKKATKVQGNLLLIRHLPDGSIYRVKSNAIHGLALGEHAGPDFGWASFTGKATYKEPGWPESIGNHEFVVYVEDHNEPGSGYDRFWIEILDRDDNVVVVMSIDRDADDNAVTLEGGNIVVPH